MSDGLHHPGRYVEEIPSLPSITPLPTSVTAFLGHAPAGPVGEPQAVASLAEFERVFGPVSHAWGLGYAVRAFFANGGQTALAVRVEDGSTAGTALASLDSVDLFNLLVLPPITPDSQVPDEVWPTALDYVQKRRAFLLVDPPPTLQAAEVRGWADRVGLGGAAARNAALYYPRLDQRDPADGVVRPVAPSGAVAGVYARTDAANGVGKAPAGQLARLVDVVGPSVQVTDAVGSDLNRTGVNVIRSFRGMGTLVWGSRTLRGADAAGDEYKYVPVRRLALHIEESLHRGTQWAVFEPNAEPLWARLRLHVGAFLQSLFRAGALQGVTAREAYFVKCDHDTTTQTDIAAGLVHVVVGFAPIKPAEFLVLDLQILSAAPP